MNPLILFHDLNHERIFCLSKLQVILVHKKNYNSLYGMLILHYPKINLTYTTIIILFRSCRH